MCFGLFICVYIQCRCAATCMPLDAWDLLRLSHQKSRFSMGDLNRVVCTIFQWIGCFHRTKLPLLYDSKVFIAEYESLLYMLSNYRCSHYIKMWESKPKTSRRWQFEERHLVTGEYFCVLYYAMCSPLLQVVVQAASRPFSMRSSRRCRLCQHCCCQYTSCLSC